MDMREQLKVPYQLWNIKAKDEVLLEKLEISNLIRYQKKKGKEKKRE